MAVSVEVKMDEAEVAARIKSRIKVIQKTLDAQVLKDSNFYCPLDTGMLQKSAIIHTVIGSGRITWKTPYAKRQYYEENRKSREHNPNACAKWFEAAKAKNLKTWEKIINEAYKKI